MKEGTVLRTALLTGILFFLVTGWATNSISQALAVGLVGTLFGAAYRALTLSPITKDDVEATLSRSKWRTADEVRSLLFEEKGISLESTLGKVFSLEQITEYLEQLVAEKLAKRRVRMKPYGNRNETLYLRPAEREDNSKRKKIAHLKILPRAA
ncbi:MAG: hypothetical protein AAB691_04940 [Patescibacteria group bacterium]